MQKIQAGNVCRAGLVVKQVKGKAGHSGRTGRQNRQAGQAGRSGRQIRQALQEGKTCREDMLPRQAGFTWAEVKGAGRTNGEGQTEQACVVGGISLRQERQAGWAGQAWGRGGTSLCRSSCLEDASRIRMRGRQVVRQVKERTFRACQDRQTGRKGRQAGYEQ